MNSTEYKKEMKGKILIEKSEMISNRSSGIYINALHSDLLILDPAINLNKEYAIIL